MLPRTRHRHIIAIIGRASKPVLTIGHEVSHERQGSQVEHSVLVADFGIVTT
ncbi:hypothetical protein ACFQ05_41740 [Amycolatopsis umgeniensis]|uniref:Uncharacterized protein n=1 Tax=Amycolatopsis umgeniensis TaxID=336628 RepID=A0A841AQ29_9PSEU|nr:hypothetical protein [Amycolatopsis umgeniensis]MBB5850919.1 hypothetical protein [Amycolatopsis umgeniensis]